MESSSKMLKGEKEWADKLKKWVLQEIEHNTKEEQAVCFQELGNIYLQAGIDSKDGNHFSKASCLFNKALVLTSEKDMEKGINESLMKVRNEFMNIFYKQATPITVEQWEEKTKQNKKEIENVRASLKDQIIGIDDIMKTYTPESKNSKEVEKLMIKEFEFIGSQVQEKMSLFIKLLWKQGLNDANAIPPCNYSMLGLGSLARQEMTPYSDLEYAILVEEQSEAIQDFFKHLSYLFHLIVLDLGETPVPYLAIASLNDFTKQDGDWYFDKTTPSGFKLDGAMPWASKTPVGIPATDKRGPLSLIKTPIEMAELIKIGNIHGEAYHVADILSRTILILGDQDLHDTYKQKVTQIVEEIDPEVWKIRAKHIFLEDSKRLDERREDSIFPNAKHTYYRAASLYVEDTRQGLTPNYLEGSQWDVIENFYENKIFSEQETLDLKLWISLGYAIRLTTYFTNGRQEEKIDVFKTMPKNQNQTYVNSLFEYPLIFQYKVKSLIENCSTLMAFKLNIWLKIVPKSSGNYFYGSIPYHYEFPLYYFFAELYNLIPCTSCGNSCLRKKVESLVRQGHNLEDINFILQNKDKCQCVALGETHLKIYKFLVIHGKQMSPELCDITTEEVFDKCQKCTNLIEDLFLTLGVLKMVFYTIVYSNYSRNLSLTTQVVEHTEKMLADFEQKPECVEMNAFRIFKFDYNLFLMRIFHRLGEFEKSVKLSEKWLKNMKETRHQKELDLRYFFLYNCHVESMSEIPGRREEAIVFCQEVLQGFEKAKFEKNDVISSNYFTFVFHIVNMLFNKKCYGDAEEMLIKHFFSDKKIFDCDKEDILYALLMRAPCCDLNKMEKDALESYQKAYNLMEDENIKFTRGILDRDKGRYTRGKLFLRCFLYVPEKIKDVPNVIEFHRLACKNAKTLELASVEHKVFLIAGSMELFFCEKIYVGLHFLLQALTLQNQSNDKKELDPHLIPVTWVDILEVLFDTLDVYSSLTYYLTLLPFVYQDIYRTTDTFFKIYMDYRLCHNLVNHSMKDCSYLQETIQFLHFTCALIKSDFPQCKKAIKWVELATQTCCKKLYEMLPGVKQESHEWLLEIMETRQGETGLSVSA